MNFANDLTRCDEPRLAVLKNRLIFIERRNCFGWKSRISLKGLFIKRFFESVRNLSFSCAVWKWKYGLYSNQNITAIFLLRCVNLYGYFIYTMLLKLLRNKSINISNLEKKVYSKCLIRHGIAISYAKINDILRDRTERKYLDNY